MVSDVVSKEFRDFLRAHKLDDFESAILEVTGLQPCLKDFVECVDEADLAPLLEPPHDMKRPLVRKFWFELGRLKDSTALSPGHSIELDSDGSQHCLSPMEAAHSAEKDDRAAIDARIQELFKVLEPTSNSKGDRENRDAHELSAGSSAEIDASSASDDEAKNNGKQSVVHELSEGSSEEETTHLSALPGLRTASCGQASSSWTSSDGSVLLSQRVSEEPAAKRMRPLQASAVSLSPRTSAPASMLDKVRLFLLSAIGKHQGNIQAGPAISSLYKAVPGSKDFLQQIGGVRQLCEKIGDLTLDGNTIRSSVLMSPERADSVQEASFERCKGILLCNLQSCGGAISMGKLREVIKLYPSFQALVDRSGGIKPFCTSIAGVEFESKSNSFRLRKTHSSRLRPVGAKAAVLQSFKTDGRPGAVPPVRPGAAPPVRLVCLRANDGNQSGKSARSAPSSCQKQAVPDNIDMAFEKYMKERRREG
eukprot:TRINITY_DN17372_c0_g1_i1.p1 TRINITY_DN17372_c0_g1~~TRINITY_DN17372_c0_g1_i1.p1  ORF type:complete len:489 (+),score=82.85 TRINITY_DN17372_c0_g1_i1:33-1469(+)